MLRYKLGAAAAVMAIAGTAHVAAADDRAPAPRAVSAQGGLSITPGILEQTARSGASGSVRIENTSGRRLRVRVRPRPWRQASSGTVAADRRRTLSRNVRVRSSRFILEPSAGRTVSVSLRRVPSRRSLYGSLETVGRPTKRRRGINVAYRLVSSLRFNPTASARRLRLGAGGTRVSGRGRSRTLSLRVRNRGNTIDPVSGSVSITGSRGGRNTNIAAKAILPGKRINLRLASLAGMPRGSYRASVTLRQANQNRVSVTRRFRIR